MAKRPSKVDWKSEGRRSAGRELRFATKPEEVVIISVGEVMIEKQHFAATLERSETSCPRSIHGSRVKTAAKTPVPVKKYRNPESGGSRFDENHQEISHETGVTCKDMIIQSSGDIYPLRW